MSLAEENNSLGSKVLMIFGMSKDSLDESESRSDREEGEDEENIQEAINQLYIEHIKLAKIVKAFKKKTKSLAPKK